MNRAAAAAAAAGVGATPAWQEVALDAHSRADPWELEGACSVLRDTFEQLFPALKSKNALLASVIGIKQLDLILSSPIPLEGRGIWPPSP